MEIGKYYELEVAKEVDFGVYLNSELGEILLPLKYVPEGTQVGDRLTVFLHKDSEDRLLATTLEPKGKLGDFVSLTTKDVTPHGAFMDWGLEKDLFVPNREQHTKFEVGQSYVVRICLDYKTDRLIGVSKLNAFLSNSKIEAVSEGDEVTLLIYDETDRGFLAVVNQKYGGLVYKSEIFEPIAIGDTKKGYIKKIREDNKIDLSLSPAGTEAIDINRDIILDKLKSSDGFLALHDKSDPADILHQLNMSKKAFKKAIGGLYKDKQISIEDEGIKLL
ncbi:nucleic acid-binding OB-fold domain protein [Fulvivirga imtechensis AK7]|uniref:Nucleic acid-binding OB-fold domain protein n=1 Tax=Fulvivirga imtechensis AK7 TaxID=1237149 RepID=L8JN71_9BACT|nr:S1-like domain-containing RNA-binding protein [Fulvivirga imtechensis]ELR68807.1 nucleic acid-binding OB-fold domain protein [Fulvivirga imtechensis AK7]